MARNATKKKTNKKKKHDGLILGKVSTLTAIKCVGRSSRSATSPSLVIRVLSDRQSRVALAGHPFRSGLRNRLVDSDRATRLGVNFWGRGEGNAVLDDGDGCSARPWFCL